MSEQIQVILEHVDRTAVTTLDGNMVSQVIQQGDCNTPATYQALMNHIFGEYIGVFLDVYLDDTIIYSDTLEEHLTYVALVLAILQRHQFYLSEKKIKFLCNKIKVLGRIVSDKGIQMDPEKVDQILHWKPPTNRTLCCGFIGTVGYLADDIYKIQIPLGILSEASAETKPFKWDFTEQRAFEVVKKYVAACAPHARKPLDYGPDCQPIWMMTDACGNGVGSIVAQGPDWKSAKITAFYSAKLSSAQQNYPVHEQELLSGVETMLRHHDILQGIHFIWVTDHESLKYLLTQKSLSDRQAHWLEKLLEFDFEIRHIPGTDNLLPDALSQLYEFDSPGTIQALSEYVKHNPTVNPEGTSLCQMLTASLLVGPEAMACTPDVNLPTLDDDWELIHHEEVLPPPKPRARKPPPPPAEMGQPEMGTEFAE